MELRKHDCMLPGRVPLWPPDWKWTFGEDNTHPIGEIGVLEKIQRSTVDLNACYLTMSHRGASYIGRLHFDRARCCELMCELMPRYYGRSLQEIGELDIPTV